LGLIVMLTAACGGGGGGGGGGQGLATDQTLRFPIVDDVEYLDPGKVSSAVDIAFVSNVFSGVVKFDNNLKIVPDLVESLPDISSDGKTYTFKLRKNAKFSNGDPVTSKDVIYSWTRGAAKSQDYGTTFDPVVGGPEVEAGKATSMTGLVAKDDQTVVATLSQPAGYFISALALPVAGWIVDQKAVQQGGDDAWWQKPETLIGSGPYKMTQRTPKASMDFVPVANWWGGSTGTLTKIHADIGISQSSSVQKFEAGGYELIGMANNPPDPDSLLRYKNDPTKTKLLHNFAAARTTWLGFNYLDGPFKGPQGHDGRLAFAKAIDRGQLADIGCVQRILCVPATGGWLSKGLKGYLGDNQDPNAKFDPTEAKTLLKKWDPDGSKVQGLKVSYNTSDVNDRIFGNIQSQLQANLGVKVDLDKSDFPTLLKKRRAKQTIMFRDSWQADYDHPQDWFDNLFNCQQAAIGKSNNAGYCNPDMDKILTKANTESLDKSVPEYQQAQKMMVQDVVGAPLFYSTQPYFTQSYVDGSGHNGFFDYYWSGIRVLKH